MENQSTINHDLIEYLLSALDAPGNDSAGFRADSFLASAPSHMQVALEVKKFMDQMPGGFFIYHAEENEEIIYANKALLRIFGCDTAEEFRALTGNSFRGIVHPDDLEAVEKSIWEQIARSQHDLDYVEYRIIQKSGEIRWIEDYGHFIRSETFGNIFYVFVGDATEKWQKQEAEHLQRLEVIEGLSVNYDSIFYIDLDSNQIMPYRLSSRAEHHFKRLFHTDSYDTFIDSYINSWVCEDDRPMLAQTLNPDSIRSQLSCQKTFYVNFRTLEKDETQYLQLRIAKVGNADRISRIVLGSRRVDDEIRHEIEQKKVFEDAWTQARQANITKSTFLSNMSHDMRTPLNAITGYTSLARSHADNPEKVLNYLNKIETSSDHLLRLVTHILEISQIESGDMEVVEAPCKVRNIIEAVRQNISPRANAKQITFTVDNSGVKHDEIYCDSKKLIQVLIYLLGNAVKYTENHGHVLLTISEEKEPTADYAFYQFAVKDDGIGIEEADLERIFEPFERVSSTTFCGVFGTGLGLTLAKNFVEMMSGHISVESQPGVGSTFTVSLRLRTCKDYSISPQDAVEIVKKLLTHRKILLVDDNELNLEIEAELFQDVGLSVDTADNGQTAVDKIIKADPDEYALILMDIQMPVMDGHEAARTIRRLKDPVRANIPIIALSANAFDEDRRMSRESGMNAHMAKPMDLSRLLELIATIIQH